MVHLMQIDLEHCPIFSLCLISTSLECICLNMKYLWMDASTFLNVWICIDRKEEMKGIGPGGSQVTADEAAASLSSLEDKILNQYNFAKVLHLTSFS